MTNFLEQGALLRTAEGNTYQWHLLWGPFKSSLEPIKHEISIFCPDFYDLEKASYWSGAKSAQLTSEQFRSALESYLVEMKVNPAQNPDLAKAAWRAPSKEKYEIAFNEVQGKITREEIRKAVPVAFERMAKTTTAEDRALMLLSLLDAPATLHVYGFWQSGNGILGATPETLFIHENSSLTTMALAGTCPKTESSTRVSLLEDPKERSEHDMVAQDITQRLNDFGEVRTKGPYLLELPSLWHLKTDIEVSTTNAIDYRELIKRLHPTPALGVFPRSAGYHWMKQLPGQEEREGFGAPFAVFLPNKAVCLVAIRNLQWNQLETRIGAGGGVVAASELEREWRELYQKRESVKKILGLSK